MQCTHGCVLSPRFCLHSTRHTERRKPTAAPWTATRAQFTASHRSDRSAGSAPSSPCCKPACANNISHRDGPARLQIRTRTNPCCAGVGFASSSPLRKAAPHCTVRCIVPSGVESVSGGGKSKHGAWGSCRHPRGVVDRAGALRPPQLPVWRNPNPSSTASVGGRQRHWCGCLACLPPTGATALNRAAPAGKERCVWQCDPSKFAHLLAGVSVTPWPVLVGPGKISRCTVRVEVCLS